MPGIGGGLGGAVGLAKETTYGTFVAPARWIEVHDAKMQERRQDPQQGTGLASGRSVDLGTRRVSPWFDGGGTVDMEVLNSGMALLLANIMGSSTTLAQIGTTTAYSAAFSYGVPDNQNYFSMQVLAPDTGGTIKQQNYEGCKIIKATFTIERGGLLMLSIDVDAQNWQDTSAAGTPSYTENTTSFSAIGMNFSAGTFGSEAALDGVRKFELTIERTLDVKRIYLGDSQKAEPITIGVTKISGSMDIDLLPTNKAVIWDLFNSQAAVPSIVADFIGGAIGSSGHNNELKLNVTNAFIDSAGTPELDGPDLVKATIPFTGLIDSANDSPLTATLTTGDTGF